MLIAISEIKINPGRREADPADVRELADSIRELGLLNPIVVDKKYTLIAGLHRLEAAKLLGWNEIKCTVSSLEGLKAELAEIDENVVRSDLSAVEFGDLLLRRKEIYEVLHPETKVGVAQAAAMNRAKGNNVSEESSLTSKSFVQDTAEKLGVTPRTVEKQIQTAKNLVPEVKKMIRETDTKIGKEAAMKLSRLNPEQQKEAAVMLASGKVRSVEQYKEIKAPQPPKEPSQSAPDGQIDSKDEVPQSTLAQPAPSRAVDDDAPYRLPDKHFNSFEESIADLKNSDKDSSSTPDIFLAEYSGFVRKFMREFQWFTMPHYAVVFSHLTDAQVKYLQAQNASMREALDGLLQQIEKEKKHEL